jgi:hypothetical protein
MLPLSLLNVVLSQRNDEQVAAGIMAAMAGLWLVMMMVGLAVLAFAIYCWWRIFTKAGFGGPFAFLMLIPGFGPLICILVLAFGDWPALRGQPTPR